MEIYRTFSGIIRIIFWRFFGNFVSRPNLTSKDIMGKNEISDQQINQRSHQSFKIETPAKNCALVFLTLSVYCHQLRDWSLFIGRGEGGGANRGWATFFLHGVIKKICKRFVSKKVKSCIWMPSINTAYQNNFITQLLLILTDQHLTALIFFLL